MHSRATIAKPTGEVYEQAIYGLRYRNGRVVDRNGDSYYNLDELDQFFESYDASGPAGGVRAVDVWAEVKRLIRENEVC
jgi:hypothetical protein